MKMSPTKFAVENGSAWSPITNCRLNAKFVTGVLYQRRHQHVVEEHESKPDSNIDPSIIAHANEQSAAQAAPKLSQAVETTARSPQGAHCKHQCSTGLLYQRRHQHVVEEHESKPDSNIDPSIIAHA